MKRKDEGGMMNDEAGRRSRAPLILYLFSSFILLPSSFALADRQSEVLSGINQNVGQEVDPNMLLAVALAVIALAGMIVVVSYMRKRTVAPKALNHSGKLLKEVSKAFNLKPAEVRQLKTLADQQQLSSPLVLLLCPSLLARSLKDRPASDRAMVGRIAKRVISKAA